MVRERGSLRLAPVTRGDVRELLTRVLYRRRTLVDSALLLLQYLRERGGEVVLTREVVSELSRYCATSTENVRYLVKVLTQCYLLELTRSRPPVLRLSPQFSQILRRYAEIWEEFLREVRRCVTPTS